MAKFVLITWSAFFVWQKPVSTRAKPGLHEDHQNRTDDDPQQVGLSLRADADRVLVGEGERLPLSNKVAEPAPTGRRTCTSALICA